MDVSSLTNHKVVVYIFSYNMEGIYPVNEINYGLSGFSSSLAINNFYLSAERETFKN